MGIFRYESAGLAATGPYSRGGSLCTRGAALTPRHFFTERASEGGKPGIAGLYGELQSVFRFCEGSAGSLHEPVDFPISAISFTVQLCSQQPAASGELLDNSQSFPPAPDGHSCFQTVYLEANCSALQERSNPLQTCPGTSQHPQQAPADQVEQCITQHATASS
jgi:hypothetical protein